VAWKVHEETHEEHEFPRAVVSETLAALGKQPVIIPGWTNRAANVIMQRLIPHKTAITVMGRVMRSMYRP
jgi:hypothetical protein